MMQRLLILTLTVMVGNIGSAAAAPPLRDADFYVSPDGFDAWSGTLADPNQRGSDGPFATLARARDAVREFWMGIVPIDLSKIGLRT